MRTFALCTAALGIALAAVPSTAAAQHHHDDASHVTNRQSPRVARASLVTRDNKVALMMTAGSLVMQLTDHGMAEIQGDMAKDAREESGFGRFVANMVRSGVASMLDHAIAYPLSELREARYEDGRLRFINRDGEAVFAKVQLNDKDAMEGFDPAQARAFAARVNQALGHRADL